MLRFSCVQTESKNGLAMNKIREDSGSATRYACRHKPFIQPGAHSSAPIPAVHPMQTSPIQRILVPLDLSPFTEVATERACAIAKAHNAQIDGLVVLDLPEIMGLDIPYYAWMGAGALEVSQERVSDAKQRIGDALQRFATVCNGHHVAHSEAEVQGVPADRILEAAALHDLVIMGLRTYFHFETQTGPGDSLEQVLRAPAAPVLAVPKQEPGALWSKVLVAFDGSPGACRALKEFARFAQPYAFDVTILMSAKDTTHAENTVNSAAAYLRAHRLPKVTTCVTDGDIRKVIDEDFIDTTDMVVAGIHSRRYLKDFFVGSLTRKLIDYGHTAVFLS